MEVHTFFLILLTILLTARILGELAARLQAPPVIGELLAGILLGPSLLGWIEPSTVIKLLAEIGIILLLFEVGLETDVMRLVKTGAKPVIVAMAGFLLPFLFGYGVSHYLFDQDLLVSLFVGGTLTPPPALASPCACSPISSARAAPRRRSCWVRRCWTTSWA